MIASFVLATLSLTTTLVVAEQSVSPAFLFSRQVGGFDPSQIPTSCIQSKCSDYVNALTQQNCMSLDCLCTATIVNAMKSCQQCVVDANIPGLTQSDIDDAISGFVEACSDAGHPVSGVSTGGGSVSSDDASTSTGGSSATGSRGPGTTTTASSGSSSATSPGGSGSGSTSTPPSSGVAVEAKNSVFLSLFGIALGVMVVV